MPRIEEATYPALRPFTFHGVRLTPNEATGQAAGECPFCGAPKFGASLKTGLWDCKAQGGHITGNPVQFLRQLHEASLEKACDLAGLARHRKLLDPDTLSAWGVCRSLTTDDWLVPGYSSRGEVVQLYRYLPRLVGEGMYLLPTPGLDELSPRHGIHGVPLYDKAKHTLLLTEGVWDGMALWETLKANGGLKECNVLAVPGCNVFQESWLSLFMGKRVIILYDNDHPHRNPKTGKLSKPAGLAGTKRVASLLMNAKKPASQVDYLCWGKDGYDLHFPSGYDLRDHLTKASDFKGRMAQFEELLKRLKPAPTQWAEEGPRPSKVDLDCLPCSSWHELTTQWKKAMQWRQELQDFLSVIMAVCCSTMRVGDQLFLQAIGPPSSGKSTLCDALLVSETHTYPLEHLTGFYSGWKDGTGKDYSLLARLNGKCAITSEGDTLVRFGLLTDMRRVSVPV